MYYSELGMRCVVMLLFVVHDCIYQCQLILSFGRPTSTTVSKVLLSRENPSFLRHSGISWREDETTQLKRTMNDRRNFLTFFTIIEINSVFFFLVEVMAARTDKVSRIV